MSASKRKTLENKLEEKERELEYLLSMISDVRKDIIKIKSEICR